MKRHNENSPKPIDVSKLSKTDRDYVTDIEIRANRLADSGKPSKIMGKVLTLPLCQEAIDHFAKHKHEYVWRAEPISGARADIDGLYAGLWLTDKFDHIPILLASEQVMKHILGIK